MSTTRPKSNFIELRTSYRGMGEIGVTGGSAAASGSVPSGIVGSMLLG